MKNLIIYDTATGDIIRCISCPESMAESQVGAGEAAIEHERVDDSLWRVDLQIKQLVAR